MAGRPLINSILRLARAAVAIAMIGAAMSRSLAGEPEKTPADLELKIKAVLVLKLINYVEWPASAFATNNGTFRIGILGDDPFGKLLDEVMAGESPHGRLIEIQRAATPNALENCQLILITTDDKNRSHENCSYFRGKPVLTVGETDQFARKGGMVGFVREKNNVRFEINLEACQAAGLNVSSRLASIARVVESQK